jgi:hypothetical protein
MSSYTGLPEPQSIGGVGGPRGAPLTPLWQDLGVHIWTTQHHVTGITNWEQSYLNNMNLSLS